MIEVHIVQSSMDVEQCFDIRRSVFCGILNKPSESVFDENDRDAIHALATKGNKPVGSGRVALRDGEWWMELVAVLPGFQGDGAGRSLVEALVAEAGRRKIEELRVQADPMYNDFLKSLHFEDGVVPVRLDKG